MNTLADDLEDLADEGLPPLVARRDATSEQLQLLVSNLSAENAQSTWAQVLELVDEQLEEHRALRRRVAGLIRGLGVVLPQSAMTPAERSIGG